MPSPMNWDISYWVQIHTFGVGIMRAKWGPEKVRRMAKGDLLLRPEQAATMKANLLGRLK